MSSWGENMYSLEFCNVYNEYGWDYFSITMGDAILRYFEINKKNIGTHLDLGCGVGTICDYFYEHNIQTMGIDISKDMIDISKNKNKNINYLVADMISYTSDKKFDLITLTCDVVNHVLEEEQLEKMFLNIYNILNDDGYLIFDIYDKKQLELNTNIVVNRDEGIKVHFYISEKDCFINTNVKVMKNDDFVYEYDVLEKLFDVEYIQQLLIKANFKIVKVDHQILNETQRFKDKFYIICKK